MSFESRRIPCAFMLYVYHRQRHADSFSLPVGRFIYGKHMLPASCSPKHSMSKMSLPPVHFSLIFRHLRAPFLLLRYCGTTAHFTHPVGWLFCRHRQCPRRRKGPLNGPFAPPRAIYISTFYQSSVSALSPSLRVSSFDFTGFSRVLNLVTAPLSWLPTIVRNF